MQHDTGPRRRSHGKKSISTGCLTRVALHTGDTYEVVHSRNSRKDTQTGTCSYLHKPEIPLPPLETTAKRQQTAFNGR